jgi:hypothetical protein
VVHPPPIHASFRQCRSPLTMAWATGIVHRSNDSGPRTKLRCKRKVCEPTQRLWWMLSATCVASYLTALNTSMGCLVCSDAVQTGCRNHCFGALFGLCLEVLYKNGGGPKFLDGKDLQDSTVSQPRKEVFMPLEDYSCFRSNLLLPSSSLFDLEISLQAPQRCY